jgi:hypothetical protein
MLKIIGKAAVLALCFCLSLIICPNKNTLENNAHFTMANIEALAETESNDCVCLGTGSLDCPIDKEKVKYIVQ